MGLQFQPPNFVKPIDYSSISVESLFDNYARLRKREQENQAIVNQQNQQRVDRGFTDAEATPARTAAAQSLISSGGLNPTITPSSVPQRQDLQQAGMAMSPQSGSQFIQGLQSQPQQSGPMIGNPNQTLQPPDLSGIDQHVLAIAKHMQERDAKSKFGMQNAALEPQKTLSEIEKNKMGGMAGAPLNQDQIEAITSGDAARMEAAFPGGVVPLQALRFGTTFKNSKDAEAERSFKHKEMRNKERTSIVTQFNSDQAVKRAQSSIDAANNISGLIASGNPIADAAIPTFMARASGEVGNLSEADKAPFGGSRSFQARFTAALQQAQSGKLTDENRTFVKDLADTMAKRANENITNLAKKRAKQYARGNDFLNEDDILSTLAPDAMPESGQNPTDPASLVKSMLSQGKSRDEIKAALKAAGH